MILPDTSVWIQHFRKAQDELIGLLTEGLVLIHPFVIGEIACGNLKNRTTLLSDLWALPKATVARNTEVMDLIDDRRLFNQGIGWVDIHLLASALLSNCSFWTFDRRLLLAAKRLRCAHLAAVPSPPSH